MHVRRRIVWKFSACSIYNPIVKVADAGIHWKKQEKMSAVR
jgi:hypothetical protein